MESVGVDNQNLSKDQTADHNKRSESREGSVERKASKDREEKLRYAKERAKEERQRKIEELKAQAEAAQKYREHKEEERRRKLEEIRSRDSEKRHQVEERKRAIMEAEKERREYILRKNQERESRLETKKRERNSIGFAFGSSTPRLLEASSFGMISPSTYLSNRRSTSISNVANCSLSRRSSERELTDIGTKKRATSASGTDRHEGSRSGSTTPGRHYSNSRPGSAMSTSTILTTTNVTKRTVPAPRKPRPASIAGTGVSLEDINKLKKETKSMNKTISPSSTQTTPKRVGNMMSTSLIVTPSSSRLTSAEKKTPSKREPVTPKSASTPKTLSSKTSSIDRLNRIGSTPSKDIPYAMTQSAVTTNSNSFIINDDNNTKPNNSISVKQTPQVSVTTDSPALAQKTESLNQNANIIPEQNSISQNQNQIDENSSEESYNRNLMDTQVPSINSNQNAHDESSENIVAENKIPESTSATTSRRGSKESDNLQANQNDNADMSSSIIIAKKINTEEEAKAALAERRRLAREEAERQAELERQRIEAERQAELKRQQEEAERQRIFEEEAMRLAQEQRKAEEERLRQAIEEAKKREEEEKRKREDEERQRVEREEAERKAKEEAEKQRIEVAERLKREEKEREERRKRVEAIMSRTRKGANANTPNSTPIKENNDASKINVENQQQQQQQQQPQLQNEQQTVEVVTNKSNSSSSSSTTDSTPTINSTPVSVPTSETLYSQELYEQSVNEKENSLLNKFNNMLIDENTKKLHHQQQLQMQQPQQILEVGKIRSEFTNDNIIENSTMASTVTNGNGHLENLNKNNVSLLQDCNSDQLIDLSIQSIDSNSVNFNNNNLLSTTLVTDSHENKDLSLL